MGSIAIKDFEFLINSLYKSFITFVLDLSDEPITTLSGYKKSFSAVPSLKNSGLDTTEYLIFRSLFSKISLIVLDTLPALPTGTVLLLTIILSLFIYLAMLLAALNT